eukprot:CAMPEP_0197232410 /NCGR_PEP_ID=MMETSP1429-20130617/603_1 /TAXON_ID=49237 /ORGANISM="Chaetoceros  sp., Strain UNC1202" /LENGTH=101 /DNA_ID=CAMNT_0042690417 /DNA_START=29 /DNA_END=330 /DNA_ORIENTATION=+
MSQLPMDINRQVDQLIEKIDYLLNGFGYEVMDHDDGFSFDQHQYPSLVPLFQELRRRSQTDDRLANRLREITFIRFYEYDFTEFPSDIDIRSVFPNLRECL